MGNKFDRYLHNWFEQYAGMDIDFSEGEYFEQDTMSDSVIYSFSEATPYDDIFRNICIKMLPEAKKLDNFILALFHEVGHIISEDDFDDSDWAKYEIMLKNLGPCPGEKGYKIYYNHPIEYLATLEGMDIIKNNLEAVYELQEEVINQRG